MHRVRRKARNLAWYAPAGKPNVNPFGRVRSGTSTPGGTGDIENDSASVTSESVIPSSGDKERHDTLRYHPRHPNTFPRDGEQSSSASPVDAPGRGLDSRETSDIPLRDIEKQPTFHEPDDTSTEETKPSMRQRVFGKLGRKGKDRNDGRVEKVNSKKSKKPRKKIPIIQQVKAVLFSSWVNLMLVFVPVTFAVNFTNTSPTIVFVMAFLGIIPLAAILSFATEEVALYVGETLGGLLNATFGNAVELIVSIIALFKNEIIVVQASLIGSMLSNLLLVMGMCFFFGGLNRVHQNFNPDVANTSASLLAISIGTLLIPTAFHSFSGHGTEGITQTSRGVAIVLLIVYGCYLLFQLKSHVHIYQVESPKAEKRRKSRKSRKKEKGDTQKGLAEIGKIAAQPGTSAAPEEFHETPHEDDKEEPQLSVIGALIALCASTVLVAFLSDYLVGSIGSLTKTTGVSTNFIALIVVPIVGNAAEHATAVTVAIKDKMDLAIGVAVGSSLQIALLLFPLIIVIGWIGGKNDMNLDLDGFQVIVLVVAIWLVNYVIQDGKSHYLEGVLLMALYVVVAVAAWFYPREIPIE